MLCKPWKHAGQGDGWRMPYSARKKFGAKGRGRINRHDIGAEERG